MKVAALFSGAKDSTFAIYKAMQEGHEIRYLVTLMPENPESYMFHHPNVQWTVKQAETMGIPIITKRTVGEKEKELKDLEVVLSEIKPEIGGVVSGSLASEYQKSRIETICGRLGLESITPLWRIDQDEHWDNVLEAGFKIMMVSVSCDGLGKEWLGRIINQKALEELKRLAEKHKFNVAGEGGEFETFVLNGPIFKKGLEVKEAERVWKGDSGFYVIKRIETV